MTSLLDDWLAYRQGRADFDKSHFLGLFKAHPGESQLSRILAGFPHALAIQERVRQVLAAGSLERSLYLLPPSGTDQAQLKRVALQWWHEQARFCLATGGPWPEQPGWQPPVQCVSRDELYPLLHSDAPNAWVFEHIADALIDSLRDADAPVHALLEALYGIAADYYLAWYIAAPLIALDIDFARYFELWRQGGISVVLEDRLLVAG